MSETTTTSPAIPPRGRRREVSMADVAVAAGVSGQTVSRVANGRTNVDPDTRQRVLDAMATLGYRPNSAARALRSGRFRSIGVIMFSLSSYGNTRTLDALASVAAASGYSITLITLHSASQSDVSGAFLRLREHAVDGIVILIETHRLGENELSIPSGLPVVVVDSSADYPYAVVDNDQAQGARLATEHLLDLGHESVWHVSGPLESFAAERRRVAWRAALESRECRVPDVLIGDWTAESGHRIGADLAQRPEVTAVFAANDQMALGLLGGLHEAGLSVPGDISVVGFDDIPDAAFYWPKLTTVRQDFDELARRAVAAVIGGAEAMAPDLSPVAPVLVRRDSVAPPR